MPDLRASFLVVGLLAGLTACGGREGPPAPVSHHGESRPALSRAEAASGAVVVQQGETLYAISRRTGVTLRALIDSNGLQAPYRLQAGQRLALPGRGAAMASLPSSSGTVAAPPPMPRGAVDSAPIAPPPVASTPVPAQAGGASAATANLPAHVPLPPASPSQAQANQTQAAQTQAAPAVTTTLPPSGASPPVPPPAPNAGSSEAPRPSQTTAGAEPSAAQAAEEPPAAGPRPPAAAAVETPAPARASKNFLWPLRGTIISTYGSKSGGLQNDGINIAGSRGAPVRAAENGVVVYAGNELKGFGNLLLLRHADGWMSAYAHLDEFQVERGQTVQRGQPIGRLGQTGSVTSPQLHFELRRGGKAVDPRGHLGPVQTAQAD